MYCVHTKKITGRYEDEWPHQLERIKPAATEVHPISKVRMSPIN